MDLNLIIKKANDILDQFGSKAVLVDKTRHGFISIGYKGGYLLSAINEALGAQNWRHNLHSVEFFESPAKTGGTKINVVAKVSIQILEENKVIYESGIQAGGAFVVYGAYADAIKSSLSDAVGKSWSMLGLGSKAYKGELIAPKDATVVESEAIDDDIASTITNTISPVEVSTTNAVAVGGFKVKANGNNKAVEPAATASAPTARFRSSGLGTGFQKVTG